MPFGTDPQRTFERGLFRVRIPSLPVRDVAPDLEDQARRDTYSDALLYGHRGRVDGGLCRLTFELSGRRRQDARPGLVKMYRVPPDRAWWPAVGAPLERGVRRHAATNSAELGLPNLNRGVELAWLFRVTGFDDDS